METIDFVAFLLLTASAFLALCAYKSFRAPRPSPQRKLKRKVEVDVSPAEGAAKLTDLFDRWFIKLVVKSGIQLNVKTTAVLLGSSAVLAGAIGFVADWEPVFQLFFSVAVFSIGIGLLVVLTKIRIRKFASQFPSALDLMARSTRSGGSFEVALAIAGNQSEQPIRSEFLQCVQQLKLGQSATEVVRNLANRIGNLDTQIFAHTIGVHQNLGGRLADALEKLSDVIRDRAEYVEKVRAATDIGRFAVVAIVFMAFFVFLFLMFAYPEYLAKLYVSELGQKMIVYAGISELVGLIWVFLTLKSEY